MANASGPASSLEDPSPGGKAIIIGAGPAGLTAAYELTKLGRDAVIYEQDDIVGGLSRTVTHEGFRFDIGGHRFFTKVPLIQETWEEILGEDFLERPRLSRIYYDDHFFDYPLRPLNALRGLGVLNAVRVMASYFLAQLVPHPEEKNFEQWVTNRFGRRLFEIFFKTYTEKVWGVPCTEISADWASQRIKNLDLMQAVRNALLGGAKAHGEVITTLIDKFYYPRFGPGMMWEKCRDRLQERGVETHLETTVVGLRHEGGRIRTAVLKDRSGRQWEEEADSFISSMPLGHCLRALDPPLDDAARSAADRLRYRDFLTVVLVVDRENVFPDNWIYIHSSAVRVGRVQNFKNWSPYMVPDPSKTALGLEYFVHEGDDLWLADDDSLLSLGAEEMRTLGLLEPDEVVGGSVVRMKKAYPIYDSEYKETVDEIRGHLAAFENLQVIGRNGQHRYNNQDHSMLAGILAARNITGQNHDVWEVNVDQAYHEETTERQTPAKSPAGDLETLIVDAFARYDAVALGTAIGVLNGSALFFATAILLVGSDVNSGPNLGLLGNYLVGYEATWSGAFVGLVEGALGGFALGYLLARSINLLVGLFEVSVRSQLQLGALDPLDVEPTE